MHRILYTLLLVAFAGGAKSQVIYTDINPDTTIVSHGLGVNYSIFLDNDVAQRITFTAFGNEDRVSTSGNIELIVDSTYKIPAPIPLSDTIQSLTTDPTNAWRLLDTLNGRTLWPGYGWFNGDQYLAFRLKKTDGWHYGWVRVNAGGDTASTSFFITIKDYVYNNRPDEAIIAGQKSALGINTGENEPHVSVLPNPAHDFIRITTFDPTHQYSCSLYNVSGSEVLHITVNNETTAYVGKLARGAYMLILISDSGMAYRQRVLLGN